MGRFFEKISFEQFKKDVNDDYDFYKSISLPERKTKYSAAYDLSSTIDGIIPPNGTLKIPTGLKASMNDDEVLLIIVRSSTGFKYNVRLVNQVGVVDKDYYNNIDNEGHIFIKLHNHSDKDFIIKKNDRLAQGLFTKYLTVDNEKNIDNERTGGLGSTKKGE